MLNRNPNPNRHAEPGVVRIGAIALAITAMLLPACADLQQQAVTPNGTTTTEDVAEETRQLLGQTVTLTGSVEEIVGENAFIISDDQVFNGANILVVNATGQPFTLPDDQTVEIQVTGEVRNFQVAEAERDFDLNLQPDHYTYTDYENRPAIIGTSLALAPTPGQISENPTQFYGRPIAVRGEVEEIMGANAFTLEEDRLIGGDNLLVLGTAEPTPAIQEGEEVIVMGEVRPLVMAEFERDYDLTWDLNVRRTLEAEYTNQPVLIAEGIYPSTQ